MMMMMIISRFGQLGLWVPYSKVWDVFTSSSNEEPSLMEGS
jgi:hypothetical protein